MGKFETLRKEYEKVEIPEELESTVREAIRQAKKPARKPARFKQWALASAAAAALFIGSINLSPAFAQTLGNYPVIGTIVEVLTVQRISLDKGNFQADLAAPSVQGLEDKDLQASLNERYIDENRALFEQFEKDIGEMKEGHLGLTSGYEVKTDTEQLLSIARYVVLTAGSSATELKYDTVDKQKGIVITLPSLFKDDAYIEAISSYITAEMDRQMASDEGKTYFNGEEEFATDHFEQIAPDQDFYITEDHHLVISFDEYEVAPGYMGTVTFEIPSSILSGLLVGDEYIK